MSYSMKRIADWFFTTGIVVIIVAGLYLLLLVAAPSLPNWPLFGAQSINVQQVLDETPVARGDRLLIPKLDVDIAIATGDASVLDKGAWHRQPQNGDPEKGGNFVLSAHRFTMGFTPQQTRAKSPLYHIDQLKEGDTLFIDYHNKRYAYTVTRLYDVPRTAREIEAPSEDPKLTLYSCGLRGEAAGRAVVEARLES